MFFCMCDHVNVWQFFHFHPDYHVSDCVSLRGSALCSAPLTVMPACSNPTDPESLALFQFACSHILSGCTVSHKSTTHYSTVAIFFKRELTLKCKCFSCFQFKTCFFLYTAPLVLHVNLSRLGFYSNNEPTSNNNVHKLCLPLSALTYITFLNPTKYCTSLFV